MFAPPPVPAVTPDAVADDAVLLDVREPDEWAAGHVAGALHVPLAELPGRRGELPTDREVVVVCRSGSRSARAVAWLNAQGYRTRNLQGGMRAWAAAGRGMVADGPAPPRVA